MKKILAFLLACVMVLGLVACGTSNEQAAEATEPAATEALAEIAEGYTGPTGEITFSAWGSDNEVACDQKAVEAFMATHPGTKVNLEIFNDQYGVTVETRYLGGQSPDVIYGHPATLLKWMQEGMLLPIDDIYEEHEELWDDEIYATELYEAYKMDDHYYATPVGACTTLLFYNKTKLDEAGLSYPTAETTWEELAEMARVTTNRDVNGNYSLGMMSLTGVNRSLPIIMAHGGRMFDNMTNPQEVLFNSPETVEALRWIQNAANVEGGFIPMGEDSSYLGAGGLGAFMSGNFTFFITGAYDVVSCADITDFEWDIAPLPQTMQEKGDTAVLYAGYAVSAQTKNPELAKEFAYFMTSYEAQKIMAETGLITTLRKDVARSDEVLNFPGAPEHHYLRVDTIAYAENRAAQLLSWGQIQSAYKSNIEQLIAMEITPEECAAAIHNECERLLNEELGR